MPNKLPALLVALALCSGVTAAAQAPPPDPPPILWCSPSGCNAAYLVMIGNKIATTPSIPFHGEPRRMTADTVCWPWQNRPMLERPYRAIKTMPPNSIGIFREIEGGLIYCYRGPENSEIFSDDFESGDTSAWSEGKQ